MSGWGWSGWNSGWKGGNGGWSEDNWRDGGKEGKRGGKGKDRDRDAGKGQGGQGGQASKGYGKGQKDAAPAAAKPRRPGEALQPGESLRLNVNDCENGLLLMGSTGSGTRERARRKTDSGTQWAGVRADCGVGGEGLWAFCVWNETGGNLRIGWSTADAKLALGTDRFSWGFGGTATKSHAGNFEKFGQTFGKDDAITCCVDLERRAILYFKNGREIPGDAFTFGKELSGEPLYPHVYAKEATFSISFDGSGGAPPLSGGFKWIAEAGSLVPHPTRVSGAGPAEVAQDEGGDSGPKFVLTPYGWRTVEQAGGITQEWRTSLDAYVRHFTSSLELEYEAERQAVLEKVQKRSTRQLQDEGIGIAGLCGEFDAVYGRVTLWPDGWRMPYLSEIKFGRAVLLSTTDGGVDLEDPKKTISAEVESIRDNTIILSTPYERLPSTGSGNDLYRVDLGPNIIANKRIDKMLDELQRCLGVDQAANPRDSIQKLNYNANLCGLLLPGAPLADALYADIHESSAAAAKWDPLTRAAPNAKADISRHAREKDIGAEKYTAHSDIHSEKDLNESQQNARDMVLEQRRRFTLVQGPPGTGKTTTAVAIICGWLKSNRGPVLASAFSNKGCDNVAQQLHALGVKVLRMGLCSAKEPYSLETRLQECGLRRGDKGMKAVFENVDVICATCIGCGMGPLDSKTFPFIVIDEAAQVIEPAVILPLGKGAVQAVMVGDQCQLPATVLSQEAQAKGLDISMFDRLLSMGMEYTLLTDQYRMHPSISAFPSWRFYRGELKNAVTDADRQLPPGLPFRSPLVFLHVDAMESSGGASKKNEAEADCVAWVVEQVMQHEVRPESIGVISPYGAQVKLIQRSLPYNAQLAVQVSTVDAFQGSEREVIIFSLVRANRRGDVGFVADWRRLNVALTRARRLCVVIGNIPTWLQTESSLLRDWLGFHQVGKADVRAFRGYNVTALPADVAAKANALRQDFATKNPAPQKLARTQKAERNVSVAGKKAREITQALEDAIKASDEVVLKSVITQAKEAGIEKSIIDEAETVLESLAASKKLQAAMQSRDPTALVQAIILAKMTGVDEEKVQQAEDLMNELVVPSEEHGRSFYAPAPKTEKESEVAEEAPTQKKKKKSWAGLLNTGPKYAGRNREEDDAPPPEPEPVKPPEATMPESKGKEGKAKGKGKGKDGKDGKGKDGKDDGKPYLVVDPNAGAGVELTATCWGMHVDEVEDEPGQPHLQAGCTITAIDGTSLLGLEDEDAVVATFGEKFKNGAIIEVDPATFDTLELPPDATHWPVSFQEDLDMLASKFALDCSISKLGLELAGPSVAMEPAKLELRQLLDFYVNGQSAEQQKQRKVDQEAIQMAIRQNQERLRREAEEYAAWQAYVQQMQDTYTAYAIAAHQAMQQQMMQVAMQQQAMQQHAMAMQHQQQTMAMPQAVPQHTMQQGWQQPCAPYAQQPQSMYGANAQAMFQMPAEWVLYYDQQGQPYYYNERTGDSAWSLAPGTNFRQGGHAACGGCGCGGCGMPYGQQQPMWGQPGYGQPWG